MPLCAIILFFTIYAHISGILIFAALFFAVIVSKEDSIHALVWPDSKRPPYGALDNWKEPYNYVNSIMFYYDAYKKMYESNIDEPASTTVKKKKSKKKK